MKKLLLCVLSLVFILALFLSGCAKTEEEMVKITVSEVTHSVFYAPQYVAIALGYFEEEGLEVELVNGAGADNVMTAVISGQVEIGLAGPEATVYVYNEGKEDYAEIFAQLTKRDGSFIMSREENPDFTYEDLIGKHVLAGRKGGMPYMTLEYVLKQQGIDLSRVELDTSVEFAMMGPTFAADTGDYTTLFEPTATNMELEGAGYIVASVGQDSGEIPYTAYFTLKSYAEENPEVIEKFTRALYKAQQWVVEASPREIAEAIAEFFPDPDMDVMEKVAERYKSIDAWMSDPFMTEDSFTRMQDVMEAAGELKQRAPYDKLFNGAFAEAVMAE